MMAVGTLKRISQHSPFVPSLDNPKLCIVEHYDRVHDRVDTLLKSAKGLLNLVKKRIAIEKDRIKALGKVTSFIVDESKMINFEGVLLESWRRIQEHSQHETLHRSKVLTQLEDKVVQPLSVFLLSDLEKRFQNITAEVRQWMKEYNQCRNTLQKSKEKYFSYCSEWEAQLMLLYKENGPVWEPVAGNKLYEKEQLIYKKLAECRLEYEVSVEGLNANVQALTLQHLPQALTNLQEVAEQMVSVVHSALKNFEIFQSSLIGQIDIELSSACSEFFIVPEFCQRKIFDGFDMENLPLPPSFDFDDYTYKDAALELQARKTQYRAMSLLTASELATRGAMFFGIGINGGTDKPNNIQEKVEGLNPLLVKVCTEYLQQPIGLKEEGIFRVPGVSATIRGLNADFTIPGQDDILKDKVMQQTDPNNVSGLLKLHLRENSILSPRLLSDIADIISSGSINDVPSPVFQVMATQCDSQRLQLLSGIISLMVDITSEPWKLDNKMSPRTLGIACGLSIFPSYNPGQATQLLEYLIRNNEQLKLLAFEDTLAI